MVTYDDVVKASHVIKDDAVRTPLLKSAILDDLTGANVYLKPEVLQIMGSFKFRGAFNAVSSIDKDKRSNGVVAASSGNHAQGIAEAARRLGVKATIVMPSDSPKIKINRTKRAGADIVLYDRMTEDRVEICNDFASKTNATFIHPYDNPHVVAGQGTCGLEICEDLKAQDQKLDRVFVCTGGGGLTAGINLAVKEHYPSAIVHTCEPENFDDYARSLVKGERLSNTSAGGSVCDAIVTPSPGEISFQICKDAVGEGKVCTDQEAMKAVAFAFNELKLSVEPGGAIALAALLQADKKFAGETIVVTLSGGNIDPDILAQCLAL